MTTQHQEHIIHKLCALLRGGHSLALAPFHRLHAMPEQGHWAATEEDPQFLLTGSHPEGWVEIAFQAASTHPRSFKVYFDRGRGFNNVEKIYLGFISGPKRKTYKAIVPLGNGIRKMRLDPGEEPGNFELTNFRVLGLGRVGILLKVVSLFFRANGFWPTSILRFARETLSVYQREGMRGVWKWAKRQLPSTQNPDLEYQLWQRYNAMTEAKLENIKQDIIHLTYKPLFSILVPVYNVEERWLRGCLDSVLGQLYSHWELCIADDASTDPKVRKVLEEYLQRDSRIKVAFRAQNGHISACSNSALELASGEFIALLDNDDELTPDALYENAKLLNAHPEADMIYSDEDKLDEFNHRNTPFFKPDWSPDTILSQMYTCHLGVYRTELVRVLGGFRLGLEGSQDHDLVLRLSEQTTRIYHIPKVLYHWRTIAGSTAASAGAKSYTTLAGEKAVRDALERRGEKGIVESPKLPGVYRVHYELNGTPLISIIIPTRDRADILGKCLNSVFAVSSYQNFEIIVVDNGSTQRETFALFDKWQSKEPGRFKVLRLDIPFNYSELNNRAVEHSRGELILLLNNDIEVLTPNWLEELGAQAQRTQTGAVGAMLLYPDDTIQHSGVVLGIGGVAGHAHKLMDRDAYGYFSRLYLIANYAAVTAACLMVRREVYFDVGGLETKLQVAFNDVDFCLKILKRGYNNLVLPQVVLYHHESISRGDDTTPEKIARFISEVEYMQEHWGELIAADPYYNINLSLDTEDFSIAIPPRAQRCT